MPLSDKLSAVSQTISLPGKRTDPLWKGPEVDGVTNSLLQRFLNCRERFRLYAIEGLGCADRWNHRIGYGSMWHVCEEAAAVDVATGLPADRSTLWENTLQAHAQEQINRYPMQQQEITEWYEICAIQFPVYLEHWANHPDMTARKPILSEKVFDVTYRLPSGRVVRLKGKWDSVDDVTEGEDAGIWLQENKTKADVDVPAIQRQLRFDLQTMLYLTALITPKPGHSGAGRDIEGWTYGAEVRGVRYNVVRRPLGGGLHSIRQHKPTKSNPMGETREQFLNRLQGLIRENPTHFFDRWNSKVSSADIRTFCQQFLDPILEQLCVWYDWVDYCKKNDHDPFTPKQIGTIPQWHGVGLHWRHPYGVYNVLNEGGSTEYDEHMETGSDLGLRQIDTVFPELEDR